MAEETEIRQRFLDGMAGHLATGLVAAEPCPVCGSREHPRPAARRPGDVVPGGGRRGCGGLAEATAALEAASAEANQLVAELAELRGRADGVSVAEAQRGLVKADLAVADLEIATGDVERIERDIADRERAVAEYRAASSDLADAVRSAAEPGAVRAGSRGVR